MEFAETDHSGDQSCDLLVIGGGAAGFFCALETARRRPDMRVVILEKSRKVLSKVKVSGGGRCNVTHNEFNPSRLSSHYPRGTKWLFQAFGIFNSAHMVEWLNERGIPLHTESDGRMFPLTNDSQTIIDCFLREAQRLRVRVHALVGVEKLIVSPDGFCASTNTGGVFTARMVLVATGGNPNTSFYDWIRGLGHTVKSPLPSLFTFNAASAAFAGLMGISVPDATIRIEGTKFSQRGAVLITHWGLSGPAVIKLSAWAAEYLHGLNYRFTVFVNWTGAAAEEETRAFLSEYKGSHGKQYVVKNPLFALPVRLWEKICELSGVDDQRQWQDISKRNTNKLIENLIRCPFRMEGKTTFKEEFVTCGGVDLGTIDRDTMESKFVKNLFFAGEVLDLDGETGGFNFQAAWTTAFIAAAAIAKRNI